MQDYIITTIKTIRIDENSKIYVSCQKGLESQNTLYPEVLFLQTGMQFYYPKINDKVLLYMPNRSMDVKYAYAVRFHNEKLDNVETGEGSIGVIESFVSFFKTKLKIKSQKVDFIVQEVDFTEVEKVVFAQDGAEFLTKNAIQKIVIPSGSSAGTYYVITEASGQVNGNVTG